MNDAYSIRLAKTELRDGYNAGNVDRILSVFSDGLGDLSTGCASFWGPEAKAVLRHRLKRMFAINRRQIGRHHHFNSDRWRLGIRLGMA